MSPADRREFLRLAGLTVRAGTITELPPRERTAAEGAAAAKRLHQLIDKWGSTDFEMTPGVCTDRLGPLERVLQWFDGRWAKLATPKSKAHRSHLRLVGGDK